MTKSPLPNGEEEMNSSQNTSSASAPLLMVADCQDLIAKLGEAGQGSRDLSCELHRVSGEADIEWFSVPPYTTNLDAAIALVERKLPGWRIALNSDDHRGPEWAAFLKPHSASWPKAPYLAWTPALALCIALLKALTPNEPDQEEGR